MTESPNIPELPSQPSGEAIQTYVVQPSTDLMGLVGQALQAELQAGKSDVFDKLIALREQQITQEQEHQKEELSLREKALDQNHELAMSQEKRLATESQGSKNTARLVIAAITLGFAGALALGNADLADKVFTGAMGLLGGGGAVALNQKKKQSND